MSLNNSLSFLSFKLKSFYALFKSFDLSERTPTTSFLKT